MKVYQTIDFETDCKRDTTFLRRLAKAFPKFFEIWGESIEWALQNSDGYYHEVEDDYVIGLDCTTEGHYYVWFQARHEDQIIEGEGEMVEPETVECFAVINVENEDLYVNESLDKCREWCAEHGITGANGEYITDCIYHEDSHYLEKLYTDIISIDCKKENSMSKLFWFECEKGSMNDHHGYLKGAIAKAKKYANEHNSFVTVNGDDIIETVYPDKDYIEERQKIAKENIANSTTEKILALWELTSIINTTNIPEVRGWIRDELKKRNPSKFNEWLDSHSGDSELRNYMT